MTCEKCGNDKFKDVEVPIGGPGFGDAMPAVTKTFSECTRSITAKQGA